MPFVAHATPSCAQTLDLSGNPALFDWPPPVRDGCHVSLGSAALDADELCTAIADGCPELEHLLLYACGPDPRQVPPLPLHRILCLR